MSGPQIPKIKRMKAPIRYTLFGFYLFNYVFKCGLTCKKFIFTFSIWNEKCSHIRYIQPEDVQCFFLAIKIFSCCWKTSDGLNHLPEKEEEEERFKDLSLRRWQVLPVSALVSSNENPWYILGTVGSSTRKNHQEEHVKCFMASFGKEKSHRSLKLDSIWKENISRARLKCLEIQQGVFLRLIVI